MSEGGASRKVMVATAHTSDIRMSGGRGSQREIDAQVYSQRIVQRVEIRIELGTVTRVKEFCRLRGDSN